jgi:Flp pilus assembly protein TadG
MRAFGGRKRLRSSESGQAIIEFAVISLPMFILFLIAMDVGLFFYGHIFAGNAVREGARCAAVGGETVNVQARVSDNFPGVTPTVTVSDRTGIQPGDDVTVTATWTYEWISPMGVFGLTDSTTKEYSVTMRAEGPEISGKTCG